MVQPGKFQTWTKEISLKTYRKQIKNLDVVKNEFSHNIKYADLLEYLKTNKGIKGFPKYNRNQDVRWRVVFCMDVRSGPGEENNRPISIPKYQECRQG